MEEILAKYFSGEANEQEKKEVLDWRKEHSEEFFSFKSAWALTYSHKVDVGRVKDIVGETHTSEATVMTLVRSSWFRYAASIAAFILVSLVVYQFIIDKPATSALTEIQTLDDGTKVVLYRDATIEEKSTSAERRVVANGKIYFDVKRDEKRPFIIQTDVAQVEVLGTSFVVDAEAEKTTQVIVESGTVYFSHNPDFKRGRLTKVTLNAGELGVITPNAKGVVKRNNRDANYLAWANLELEFKRESLDMVAKLVEEVYGYQLNFEEGAEKCMLTATYKQKSPEQIARLIAETFTLTYTVSDEDKQITFAGQPCK